MITLDIYKNKLVGIVGLAKSGNATVASLLAGGAQLVLWDDDHTTIEAITEQFLSYRECYTIADVTQPIWHTVECIVMSPGISLYCPTKHPFYELSIEHNIPICCDVELLYQAMPNAFYIAVTGTNGKSTTVSLIGHVMRACNINAQVAGNIGKPVLSVDMMPQQVENGGYDLDNQNFYILELSSYQLDLLQEAKFNIAICLNITPDHIDRHGTFYRYVEAKTKIFRTQKRSDIAIFSSQNKTNELTFNKFPFSAGQVIQISTATRIANGISIIDGVLYDDYISQKSYDVSQIDGLIGPHNAENMAAAFTTLVSIGLLPETIIQHFRSYKPLPHRMHLFYKHDDLVFVNDSKATNADSTYWALRSFENIHWILGGVAKEGGINNLKSFFEKITHAYLIGEAAESFENVLFENNVSYTVCGTLENAVETIKNNDVKTGVVLLSPACSSLDQWKNFEERGDAFIKLVHQYWKNESE